jgi:hypothetical protein
VPSMRFCQMRAHVHTITTLGALVKKDHTFQLRGGKTVVRVPTGNTSPNSPQGPFGNRAKRDRNQMKPVNSVNVILPGTVLTTASGLITVHHAKDHGTYTLVKGCNENNQPVNLHIHHQKPREVPVVHARLKDELGIKMSRYYYDTVCGLVDQPSYTIEVHAADTGTNSKRITCLSCILLLFAGDAEQHDERENPPDSLGTGA